MHRAVKTVALVVFLMAGVSLAEERPVPAGAKPTPQRARIDPKTQQQLMNDAREMDQHLQELKSCLDHE